MEATITNFLCCAVQQLLGIDEDLAKQYHKLVAEDRFVVCYTDTHAHTDTHRHACTHKCTLQLCYCILIATWIVFISEGTQNILKEKFCGKKLIHTNNASSIVCFHIMANLYIQACFFFFLQLMSLMSQARSY